MIQEAAQTIITGGLVAFPTETVYGLGADAFNADAVAKVYATKGRPCDNPLILHIANTADFEKLAHEPPDYAFVLMKNFWPGSLTLVVKKDPTLSAWLGGHPSGKTETVGIRMPAHPIAREFIAAAGCPIAAPSANKSGRPSPTTAAHVRDDFGDAQMLILSGGAARVGLESTVVDCTGDAPKILRPGTITAEQVAKLLGLPAFDDLGESGNALQPRSPGTKYKHYAPKAKMTLLQGDENAIISFILKQKTGAGVLLSDQIAAKLPSPENFAVQTFGTTPEEIAQNLFSCLRQFDALNVEEIFAQALPESGIGVAIMDRLKKAAEGRIVHV